MAAAAALVAESASATGAVPADEAAPTAPAQEPVAKGTLAAKNSARAASNTLSAEQLNNELQAGNGKDPYLDTFFGLERAVAIGIVHGCRVGEVLRRPARTCEGHLHNNPPHLKGSRSGEQPEA